MHLVDVHAGHPLTAQHTWAAELWNDGWHVDVPTELRIIRNQLAESLLAPRLIRVIALQFQLPLCHLQIPPSLSLPALFLTVR